MDIMDPKDTIYIPVHHPALVHKCIEGGGAQLIAVRRGEIGYWPVYSLASAAALNHKPMDDKEIEAAVTCSMFGWHETEISKPILDWLAARDQQLDAENARAPGQPAGEDAAR